MLTSFSLLLFIVAVNGSEDGGQEVRVMEGDRLRDERAEQ